MYSKHEYSYYHLTFVSMPQDRGVCSICLTENAPYGLLWDREDRYCLPCSKTQPLVVNLFQNPYCTVCAAQRQEKPRRASFAVENQKKATWCSLHKPPDAMDITHSLCECGKAQPSYGRVGFKRKWCTKCPSKPSDAVERNPKCECGKSRPNFGLPEDKTPTWCARCPTKPLLAVDIRHKLCTCGRAQPIFGLPNESQPQWCLKCKPAEAVDCKNRRCECGKSQPRFGDIESQTPKYCAKCPGKPENAKELYRQCACGRAVPSLGLPGDTRPTWCAFCPEKPKDALNIVSRKCVLCPTIVTTITKEKFLGHCLRCFIHMFPDQKIVRNYKTKEVTFVTYLRDRLLAETDINPSQMLCDKIVGGCSRKRPDFMIDCFTHVLFTEIDENRHSTQEYSCENKRMMTLFEDVACRPIVMIHANPDAYWNVNRERVPSCFKYNKRGLSVPRDKKALQARLEAVYDRLLHHVTTVPEKEVTVEYLYYDAVLK